MRSTLPVVRDLTLVFESRVKALAARAILLEDKRPLQDRLAQAARLIGGRVVKTKTGDLILAQGEVPKLIWHASWWERR